MKLLDELASTQGFSYHKNVPGDLPKAKLAQQELDERKRTTKQQNNRRFLLKLFHDYTDLGELLVVVDNAILKNSPAKAISKLKGLVEAIFEIKEEENL